MHRSRLARAAAAPRLGVTFLELCVVLVILGLVASLTVPPVMDARDRRAARAAARDVALLLATARQVASTTLDGAAVQFSSESALVRIVVEERSLRTLYLGPTHGVALRTTRDSLAYDWRGVGHGAANLTLVVTRGAAAETLVVSRLGRVRRSAVY